MRRDWLTGALGLVVVGVVFTVMLIVVSGCYNGPARDSSAPLIWRK